jgi:short-subunit dehydrogenase
MQVMCIFDLQYASNITNNKYITQMKQTILITGASSGFGLLIARKLYESGYIVIGTSREPEKYQSGLPFKLLSLDIANDRSIESFGKELFKQITQLDVLINNAGFYLSGLAEEISIEQGRKQLETNFWGTIKLTNELLPWFRKQRFGKIITVGSIVGLISLPGGAYYAASKHALEGYFKSLRFELNEFNIKVCMVEPMGFNTNIVSNSIVAENKISDYDEYRYKLNAYTKDLFANSPAPTPVIDTVIKLIGDRNPKFSHPVGKGASAIVAVQHFAFKMFENSIVKSVNKAGQQLV